METKSKLKVKLDINQLETYNGIEQLIFKLNNMKKIRRITCYFLKFIGFMSNGITSEETKRKIRHNFFYKAFLKEPFGQYPGTFNVF